MRFKQIIAAVTRRLNNEGTRAITAIDAFVRASDPQLCMACVSPGRSMYVGPLPVLTSSQPESGQPSWAHAMHASSHAWLGTAAKQAAGKRKRLPLAARLLGTAKRGSGTLAKRDT